MGKYDELVGRLKAQAESASRASIALAEAKSARQGDNPEGALDLYEWLLPAETIEWQAAAAIATLEAELAEAQQQVKGALIMHEALSEKLEITQDELAAMKQKRLCDHGRLLFRDDVERHCANPDICFEYGGTVRCSPCAIKQADAEGIETLDIERVYLPEVARLNRELAAMKARGDRLAGFAVHKRECLIVKVWWQAGNCQCGLTQALTGWRDQ